MATVALNKKVPSFSLPATDEQTISLKDYKGKNLIIYFYPKDNTPGCTIESQDFRDHYKKFTRLDTEILGVSRDSIKSHENFKCKYDLPFPLLSDSDETLCNLFDVMKMKSMFGKKYMGIERSTFFIDAKGILRQEWRKVKISGHVEEVLASVKQFVAE